MFYFAAFMMLRRTKRKAGKETSLLRRETLIKVAIFSARWSKGSLFIEQSL